MKVLVLGGTGEARDLAAALHQRPDVAVISSLAGRVRDPKLPEGPVRIGGFGGVDGLAAYLHDERIDAMVDATHPFAATITAHAVAAAGAVPLLVLRRPGWTHAPGDDWHWVDSIDAAADVVRDSDVECVFVTTGRRDLSVYAGDSRHRYLVRTVDAPEGTTPPQMTLLLDRGPYTLAGELALMREHDVGLLVTKNSGGSMTAAKLVAARQLGIPVLVVDRPPLPAGVTAVATVDDAISWLANRKPENVYQKSADLPAHGAS